jgi:hypothetical protein
MKKPTLKQLRTFEKMAFDMISERAGVKPTRFLDTSWEWDTGKYTLRLHCHSEQSREFRGQSWLACRQLTRREWLDADGYLLPRNQCKGWNTFCTHPSGKHNLHPCYEDMDGLEAALDRHLKDLGL